MLIQVWHSQIFLEELESCLGEGEDSREDSQTRLLLRHSRLLLRSQLCCLQKKAKHGVLPKKLGIGIREWDLGWGNWDEGFGIGAIWIRGN